MKLHLLIKFIIGICLISLMGCNSGKPKAPQSQEELTVSESETDDPEQVSDDPTEHESSESLTQEEDQKDPTRAPKEAALLPALPDRGSGPEDFVPEDWTLWDSAELDFNGDGIPDYVGVLDTTLPVPENGPYFTWPRILFAIASDGPGRYCLDFQDINLIRTRDEGGVYGDPYEPLTAEGTSFTIHAYGGSAWKWSEAYTYTYKEGTWYQTMSDETYGYGSFVTSYHMDDWERGTGTRKRRSDDFDAMEKYWDSEGSQVKDTFDVEYELSLDEPPTLYQAGMRWWRAPLRVTDWSVDSIEFSEDTELSEEQVKHPDEMFMGEYCDEDCVLYTFQDKDRFLHYLAMYRFQDRKLTVLAGSDTAIGDEKLYKGKIYYSQEIVEEVTYKQIQDGQEQIVTEKGTVGICLNRMDTDGSHKETIFEYRYPEKDGRLPYLALIYEISGDEIVAEVYVGNEPHPVCRMNCDGSGLRWIGQIPAES